MDVYSTSTSTLATILRNPKLDPEYIASTTDGLADALADAEEIDQAIRDGGKIAVGAKEEVDEDELREELEGLVTEEREKEIREERRREEEKEAARKEESAMEEQRNIPENLKAQQNDEKAMAASTMLQTPQAKKDGAEAAWEARIADAQTREKEERARAEAERLRKEESRVMAE
jgi:charged multivesicular body protein 7